MDAEARLKLARTSLEGLSVGDSFGEQFFDVPDAAERRIELRELPDAPWQYTDDSQMALSIYKSLRTNGGINPSALAADFAARYDSTRGYGPSMHALLSAIKSNPLSWESIASAQMGGFGSYGNGSAMRSAPIGAYFYDDLSVVIEQAHRSSVTTHTHQEATAGAVAVAVASAIAVSFRNTSRPTPTEFLDLIRLSVPDSIVSERIRHARNLGGDASVRHAVAVLGNGIGLSAQDTVPFGLWCAAKHLNDYEKALWLAVEGLGDRDTICAITGGIVASYTGIEGIPLKWRNAREPLPDWAFGGAGADSD